MGIRRGRVSANRLRVWRAERHVTQLALADTTGLPQSRISLIENRYVEANSDERNQLAAALGVEVDDVFPPIDNSARDQRPLPFIGSKAAGR